MSPTVFNYKNYHFYFFSREESRIHVHVSCSDGEAKFWITPGITLATNYGLSQKQLKEIQRIVEAHKNEIKKSWQKHFNR